eukprot:5524416-Ditylum_brightwellii.AAC.1
MSSEGVTQLSLGGLLVMRIERGTFGLPTNSDGISAAYIAKVDAKRKATNEENDLNTAAINNDHLNDFVDDKNNGGDYDFCGVNDDSLGGGNVMNIKG